MSKYQLKGEIDKHYAALVQAMRHKVDEIVQEHGDGARVAGVYVVKHMINAAWMVVRLENADQTFLLLRGCATAHPVLHDLPDFVQADGDGFEISVMEWSPVLLPLMKMLADQERAFFDYCACGHQFCSVRAEHVKFGQQSLKLCPACGDFDGDSSAWKLVKDGEG